MILNIVIIPNIAPVVGGLAMAMKRVQDTNMNPGVIMARLGTSIQNMIGVGPDIMQRTHWGGGIGIPHVRHATTGPNIRIIHRIPRRR